MEQATIEVEVSKFEQWQKTWQESQSKQKQPKSEPAPAVGAYEGEGWDS